MLNLNSNRSTASLTMAENGKHKRLFDRFSPANLLSYRPASPIPTSRPHSNDTAPDTTPDSPQIIYTIKGVRINCTGDIMISKMDQIVEHEVSKITEAHQILHASYLSAITAAIGIPLLCIQLANAGEKWKKKGTELKIDLFENEIVTYLTLNINPSDSKWGQVDRSVWGDEVGTILVVREDKKTITIQFVEAVLYFCFYVVYAKMKVIREKYGAVGGEDKEVENEAFRYAKEEFMEIDLAMYFRGYFEGVRNIKVENGDRSWVDVVNPLDV